MEALPAAPTPDSWRPRVAPGIIAVSVMLATFMEVLDTTVVNVSLPHISGNLSVSTDESTWVITSYLVSNAIVLPATGWLSQVFGRKRFFMTCVALFAIASFLCGLAPSLTMLIVFRILQGLGGGALAADFPGDLAGELPGAAAGAGHGHLRHRRGVCAGDRSHAGRVDHGHLFLAMDLLHQRAGGDVGLAAYADECRRSPVSHAWGGKDRCARSGPLSPGDRLPAIGAGQGAAK